MLNNALILCSIELPFKLQHVAASTQTLAPIAHEAHLFINSSFFRGKGSNSGAQGLALARQVLYHWAMLPALITAS
jgi:hypothetical protein